MKLIIKRLLAHSFIQVLDEELKYLADETNDYFKYNNWKKRDYTSLTSLKLKNLKKLNLSFLGLKMLPDEIGYFQNLEELNLAGNNLRELPDSIYTLKKLKVLNLGDIISGGNNIQYISKDIEKLTNLEVLQIVWNDELKELPKQILKLEKLELLRMSQEEILQSKLGEKIEKSFIIDFEYFSF